MKGKLISPSVSYVVMGVALASLMKRGFAVFVESLILENHHDPIRE
jgi:hypothetical protein